MKNQKLTVILLSLICAMVWFVVFVVFTTKSQAAPLEPVKNYWLHIYSTELNRDYWLESDNLFIKDSSSWNINCGGVYTFSAWYKRDGETDWILNGTNLKGVNTGVFYVIDSNHDLYDDLGNIVYGNPKAIVSIILPVHDEFKDNTSLFTFWTYADIEFVEDLENISVGLLIDDVASSDKVDILYQKWETVNGKQRLNMNFSIINMPVGVHKITYQIKYNGNVIGYAERIIERLAGFVDIDGDGKDDRTGRDYVDDRPIGESPDITKPEQPQEGDLLAWMKYIGEMIGYIFEIIFSSIKNFAINLADGFMTVLGMTRPALDFVSQFFSSMPKELSAGLISLISVGIGISIFRLFRG